MYQSQFMQQPRIEKLLCASSGATAKIKKVEFHLMMFMRESHTHTNDSKRLGCLNVIAKITTKFYGPMEEKANSFKAE